MLKVKRSELLAIFETLELKKAPDWDNKLMKKKADKLLPTALKESRESLEKDHIKLIKAIKAADEWKVIGKQEDEDAGDDDDDDKKKKKSKSGKKAASGPQKVGIIDYLKELLEEASEEKPLTQEKWSKLAGKKFKDRDVGSMISTFRNQVGYHLKNKGYSVKNDGEKPRGYWAGKKAKKKKD